MKREELLAGKEEEALFISNRRVRMTQLSISRIVTKYAENIKPFLEKQKKMVVIILEYLLLAVFIF